VVALRVFFFLSLVFLTACSRQSDTSSPDVFDPSVLPNCEIVLGQQELLTSLSIRSNHKNEADRELAAFNSSIPARLSENYSSLVDSLIFRIALLESDRRYDIEGEGVEDFDTYSLANISAQLTFNGQSLALDDGEESASVPLQTGQNTISINVTAAVTVVETREGCVVSDLSNDQENPNEKNVTLKQTVTIDVNKNGSLSTTGASTNSVDRSLGGAIASWGDLVFVGAPMSSNAEGRVSVFSRNSTGWVFKYEIKASNAGRGDEFGKSIAVYGNQLVVTSPNEDGDLSGVFNGPAISSGFSGDVNENSGAVYVFTLSGSNWIETAYIKKPSNTIGASGFEHGFGSDVAIYADRLLVGAAQDSSYFDSVRFVDTGRAYLYQFNGASGWELETPLESSFRRNGDLFGASVAIHKDRVAVGAPGDSSRFQGVVSDSDEVVQIDDNNIDYEATVANSGAVYIFENIDGSWAKNAYFKAENAESRDQFGLSISLTDDKLLIGAPFEDGSGAGLNRDMFTNGSPDSGAAYYYQRSTVEEDSDVNVWNLQTYFKSSDAKEGAKYGSVLDIDNNWFSIAEPASANSNGQLLGQVSLYDDNLEQVLVASSSDDNTQTAQELFGASLTIGKNALFIGAPGYVLDDGNDGFIVGAGAFLIYE
jgi:hypothetical protein